MTPLYIGSNQVKLGNSKLYLGTTLLNGVLSQVNPNNLWKPSQQVDLQLSSYPELKPIADQPQAKWINGDTSQSTISSWATEANGKTMLLVVYAIPGRDNGQYSAGGFANQTAYLNFCNSIKAGIGNAPAIIVLEPDALGLSEGISDSSLRAERIDTLKKAVAIFGGITTSETYIETSKWISTTRNAELLQSVNVQNVAGACLNVSGYDSQSYCYSYGNDLISALNAKGISGKKYIVDSGRNGNGELTSAYGAVGQPWLTAGLAWCNPPGRAIGLLPGTVSGQPNCRASFWIKNPGESDGTFPTTAQSNYYGENAPAAGLFWVANARSLLGLTPQSGSAPAARKTSSIKESFTSTLGEFASASSGGVSIVSGRARVTADSTYATLGTTNIYSLKDSEVFAAVYPPSSFDATESWAQFVVESNTAPAGTRLRIQVDNSKIVLSNDSGYYDASAVTLDYSLNYRWLKIRETSGTVYFETSGNGKDWDILKQVPTPSYITNNGDCRFAVIGYKNTSTGYVEVDNVNTVPV